MCRRETTPASHSVASPAEHNPAIRRDDLPGDPAAVRAEQPRNQRSDLLRRAFAADERLRRPPLPRFGGQPARPELGVGDEPWRDHVCRTAVRTEFCREVVDPAVERRLHRSVRPAATAAKSRDRGNQDDSAGIPFDLLAKRLGQQYRGQNVGLERGLPVQADAREAIGTRHRRRDAASRADHTAACQPSRRDLSRDARGSKLCGHISGDHADLTTSLRRELIERLFAPADSRHVETVRYQIAGNRPADPGTRAADDDGACCVHKASLAADVLNFPFAPRETLKPPYACVTVGGWAAAYFSGASARTPAMNRSTPNR